MSKSNQRTRLYRLRRKQGLRCVTIEIRDEEVRQMIKRGMIKREEVSSCIAIRNALHDFLDKHFSEGQS